METLSAPPPAEPAAPPPTLASLVGQVAWDCAEVLSPGELAELRRLRYDEPGGPAFWRLVARRIEPASRLPEDGPARVEAERRWAVILRAVAELASLHRPGRRLGIALAAAGVSEGRVLRLLRAHGEVLFDAVRTTTHQLATAGEPVDATDLAHLVLSSERDREEEVRRRIARDFYRHLETR